MKTFTLLVLFLLPAVIFAQGTNSGSKSYPGSYKENGKVNCGDCILMLDDDITMDKLFTSIRCELIYSGAENNKVYFKHNEYLCDENGFVKKAGYTGSLVYNIAKSNVIDYRGLKIEILNAGPRELTYRVLNADEGTGIAAVD